MIRNKSLHNRKQKIAKYGIEGGIKRYFYCLAELDDVEAHTKEKSWDPSNSVSKASIRSRIGTSNSSNVVPYNQTSFSDIKLPGVIFPLNNNDTDTDVEIKESEKKYFVLLSQNDTNNGIYRRMGLSFVQ